MKLRIDPVTVQLENIEASHNIIFQVFKNLSRLSSGLAIYKLCNCGRSLQSCLVLYVFQLHFLTGD